MVRPLCVAGARPNFIKVGALLRAFGAHPNIEAKLVHTGQHYDDRMSSLFFDELNIPKPDHFLSVGSGSHAFQTARILEALEPVLISEAPDVLVVVGDVNSTLAAALVAAKLHIPVAHVEAGLRSGDRSMPEEINRLMTDAIADVLFASEEAGVAHLEREGHPPERVELVGNVMIDTLMRSLPAAAESSILADLGLEESPFLLVTMHRPATVDDPEQLRLFVDALCDSSGLIPVVWPMHPRTRAQLDGTTPLERLESQIIVTEPLGYLDFLRLESRATLAVTDSGGVQEETTVLGIPCLTLRPNTERPATISYGTNRLGVISEIPDAARQALGGTWKQGSTPPLWDGRASERVAESLVRRYAA